MQIEPGTLEEKIYYEWEFSDWGQHDGLISNEEEDEDYEEE